MGSLERRPIESHEILEYIPSPCAILAQVAGPSVSIRGSILSLGVEIEGKTLVA